MSPRRVRRVEVPQLIATSFARSTADYVVAFALATNHAESRTPVQWARVVFEDAPALLRRCLVLGWRWVLGLKLGPLSSDDHVLGWAISDGDLLPDSTALVAESRLLRAYNTVSVEPSSVTWVTLVHYSSATARVVWALARPIHHLTIRSLLARADPRVDKMATTGGKA